MDWNELFTELAGTGRSSCRTESNALESTLGMVSSTVLTAQLLINIINSMNNNNNNNNDRNNNNNNNNLNDNSMIEVDASTNTNINMALPGIGRQFGGKNYAAKCASAKLKEQLTTCARRLLCPEKEDVHRSYKNSMATQIIISAKLNAGKLVAGRCNEPLEAMCPAILIEDL